MRAIRIRMRMLIHGHVAEAAMHAGWQHRGEGCDILDTRKVNSKTAFISCTCAAMEKYIRFATMK